MLANGNFPNKLSNAIRLAMHTHTEKQLFIRYATHHPGKLINFLDLNFTSVITADVSLLATTQAGFRLEKTN